MSRIPGIVRETLSPEDQTIYDHIAAERKEIPNIFKVIMNSPRAAQVVGDVGDYARFHTPFNPALRELVILTVARWFDSEYEWSQHEPLAYKNNVNPELVERIRKGDIPVTANTNELLAIRFTYEMVSKCNVSDKTFNTVLEKFGEKATTDLIVLIGYYTMLAYCIAILKPDIDPGLKAVLPIPASIKKPAP
jgi:4-carboxymuconolactone decarboxylase